MSLIINGKVRETSQHAPTPDLYEYIRYSPDISQMEWRYNFRSGEYFTVRHNSDARYFKIVVFVPGFGSDEIIFRDTDPQAEIFGWNWGTAGSIAQRRINEIYDDQKARQRQKTKSRLDAVQLTLDLF